MLLRNSQPLMLAFLWLMALVCSKNIAPINTTSSIPTIYVDPEESFGTIGQNFTVNICISNVTDLYGWEFRLSWNSTILEAVEISEGTFLKDIGSTFFTYKINNTLGYMIVDCTLLGSVPGVSGSGVLATIKFYVKTAGECLLDLYDTILVNSAEQAIEHTEVDGYYYTSVHDVAIINLTASSTQVNVTVENQGTHTETFNISTYYTRLYDPLIGTQTVTLTKGTLATLTFTWTPPSPGRYEIRADASIVPGETDIADNVRTTILYVGYGGTIGNHDGETINGFHMASFLFAMFTSVIVLTIRKNKEMQLSDMSASIIKQNLNSSLFDDTTNIWQDHMRPKLM